MPELPEVETIKNTLEPLIKNYQILSIEVLRNATIIGDVNDFKEKLKNQKFLFLSRIGKFLIFHLSNDYIIISHLRMEGKFYFLNKDDDVGKHARVIFNLDNNKKLVFDDSRAFGLLKLSKTSEYKNDDLLKNIANEPKDINIDKLYNLAKNSNVHIKTFLLDQSHVAGLGNIYVDETLFKSNIHPLTKAKYISKKQFEILMKNADKILTDAIKLGGSTIKSYHPSQGVDGRFQTTLKIYDKKGQLCPTCGHMIRKIKVNGRGSSFCSHCQPYVNDTYNIAIYGEVGVGKTLATDIFKEYHFNVYNADKIVLDLYKNKDVIKKINNMFNLNFTDEIDKNILRTYLSNHIKDVKKLNNYIHPLVKQKCIEIMKKSTKVNNIFEIPLLYQAHMEDIFDVIILIKSKNQQQLLNQRNADTSKQLLKINSTNIIKEEDADFIINNDSDINNLKNQIKDIINKLKSRLDQ